MTSINLAFMEDSQLKVLRSNKNNMCGGKLTQNKPSRLSNMAMAASCLGDRFLDVRRCKRHAPKTFAATTAAEVGSTTLTQSSWTPHVSDFYSFPLKLNLKPMDHCSVTLKYWGASSWSAITPPHPDPPPLPPAVQTEMISSVCNKIMFSKCSQIPLHYSSHI